MKIGGVLLGLLIGILTSWIFFGQYYSIKKLNGLSANFPMLELLNKSQQKIADSNWNCEKKGRERTVAAVLESLLKSNSQYAMNKLNTSCVASEGTNLNCSIGLSNCMAWQSSDCGSRSLSFQVGQSGEILLDSFQCLDVR